MEDHQLSSHNHPLTIEDIVDRLSVSYQACMSAIDAQDYQQLFLLMLERSKWMDGLGNAVDESTLLRLLDESETLHQTIQDRVTAVQQSIVGELTTAEARRSYAKSRMLGPDSK